MRLIDADALGVTDFEIVLCGGDYKELCKTLIAKVEHAPTIDAVPVVRCKDCKYSRSWYLDKRICKLWTETGVDVFNDGFCSYGERKDDAVDH